MRRFAVIAIIILSLCPLQGCYLFGHHDGDGYHKNFAYETPERVSAGHAHHYRASHW